LRADTTPDMEVPVLVLDLNEEESDKLLATLDPLSVMAQPDEDALLALIVNMEFQSQSVTDMLEALANGETAPLWEPNLEDIAGITPTSDGIATVIHLSCPIEDMDNFRPALEEFLSTYPNVRIQ
jgi:hypothetical protein